MSGRRPGNPRSGHRAEALGVYAFTEFCAVARVPLEEDIGWDAICTILDPDPSDGRRLWAGASFWVQFKTDTTKVDEFDPAGMKWLAQLPLPYFYCTVRKADREFKVYTTYNAWRVLQDLRRKMALTDVERAGTPLKLGLGDEKLEGAGISLGAPILEWRLDGSEFTDGARKVLGAWIQLCQKQALLGAIGIDVKCRWKTNETPVEEPAEQGEVPAGKEPSRVFREHLAAYLGAFGYFLASSRVTAPEVAPFLTVLKTTGGMEQQVELVERYAETLQKLRDKVDAKPSAAKS